VHFLYDDPIHIGVEKKWRDDMGVRISELPTTSSAGLNDFVPVVDTSGQSGSVTKKTTVVGLIAAALASWWSSNEDKQKLDGIASGATSNSTDAQLRDRSTHTGTQAINTVTGLQTALDGKQASGSYASAVHSHGISDVTGLQTALDGKASSVHSHGISDVTGLQTALDGKQASGSYAPSAGSTSIVTVGAVTATSVNKVTITQPASAATITIANNKTFKADNSVTLSSSDGASVSFGVGGSVLYANSVVDGGGY